MFYPRTIRHPCSIYTGLTASVASPIIAVINATGYPSYLSLLLHKLERIGSVGRREMVWFVQPCIGVIGLK